MKKSLALRLWAGIGIILVAFAASGVISILAVTRARDAAMRALEVTGPTLVAAERMDRSVLRQHLLGRIYAAGGSEKTLIDLVAEKENYSRALKELGEIDNGFTFSPADERIEAFYAKFSTALDNLISTAGVASAAEGDAGAGVDAARLSASFSAVQSSQDALSATIDSALRVRTQNSFDASIERAELIADRIAASFAALSALTVTVAALAGALIMRGIRKPIDSLTTMTTAIAEGDRSARARGVVMAEFQPLARSFDAMVEKLDAAERELMLSYYEQRKILDAIPVGLLSIGPDYRIGPEYSAAAKELFGQIDLSGVAFDEVLYPGDDDERSPRRSDLRRYLRQLFENVTADPDFLAAMNPVDRLTIADIEGDERTLGIAFERIYNGEKVTGVLVSVADLTETMRAERQLDEERMSRKREAECIQSILTIGPLPLNEFIVDAREEIAGIRDGLQRDDGEAVNACFRSLHSLKGSAGSLGLEAVADVAHKAEDILRDVRAGELEMDTETMVAVSVALGKVGEELDSAEDLIERLHAALSRLDEIEADERDEMAEFSRQLEALAVQLEHSLSKPISIVTEIGVPSIPRFKDMKTAVIHLVRNAADHGLEDTFDRLFANKSDRGTIKVRVKPAGDASGAVVIDVEDNGAGIDFSRVEKKARAAGILTGEGPYTDSRLLSCIFSPGFSTRDEASDVSGRGVGLDLVRELVRAANGTISVATEKGRGTRFRIRVPA